MKILILSILALTIVSASNAQSVNIPDANFKNTLISAGVDTSGNGEISQDEAEEIISLDVSLSNITDMTGIEAFINLKSLNCKINQLTSLDVSNNNALENLDCGGNQLTSLDVTKNSALEYLSCWDNQLTSLYVSNNTALIGLICHSNQLASLDISKNTDLTALYCYGNQLISLDVSKNIALESLICSGNQLTSLDVSNNTALDWLDCTDNQLIILDISNNTALDRLDCSGNQLTILDVSNNTALEWLYISDMPTLYEVCVWEMPFPPSGVNIEKLGSPNAYFTTGCWTNIPDYYKENDNADIFPNPSDDIINIEIEKINNATIEIYNVSGKMIFSKAIHSEYERIDLSGFSEGIYVVKIMQDGAVKVRKVVVR